MVISFGDDEARTLTRTVSFGKKDMTVESMGSGDMKVVKGSNFKKMISFDKEKDNGYDSLEIQKLPIFLDPNNPKHQAAIKLQKVYKSFRTRRKLADCAVLIEQSWWKLLDFAQLKRSSISFFDVKKQETAISRWSRARTRAAKVGKGLSKNDKAQKLVLQHWLEAIDPRHRYGHNLHFYYCKWLHSKSKEPFFYWLDIGDGRDANLIDKCPRLKLQQQCIKYLGPMERKTYEVVVEDGKLVYNESREVLHTTEDAKWIFVLSTYRTLYVGKKKKKKGSFQHSSFLAGGVTMAAGRLLVEKGILKAVWPHSGHYCRTEENFQDFLSFIRENNVDLRDVKTSAEDEEDGFSRSSKHVRSISSEEELVNDVAVEEGVEEHKEHQEVGSNIELLGSENRSRNGREDEEEEVTREVIMKRINSKKETKSYQLGRQILCKWTTGAGPRIGCVLQFQALQFVSHTLFSFTNHFFPKPKSVHGSLSLDFFF